jgi:hypothetical protein
LNLPPVVFLAGVASGELPTPDSKEIDRKRSCEKRAREIVFLLIQRVNSNLSFV